MFVFVAITVGGALATREQLDALEARIDARLALRPHAAELKRRVDALEADNASLRRQLESTLGGAERRSSAAVAGHGTVAGEVDIGGAAIPGREAMLS